VGMPEESVKTVVRLVQRDGFPALRDRRRSGARQITKEPPPRSPGVTAQRQGEWLTVEFGASGKPLKIPSSFQVQARAVLLSLVNAGLLPVKEGATALGISAGHCRELARKLRRHDVAEALIDKRQGQKRDYRVGPAVKAEVILELAARTIVGRSTSSDVLADAVNQRTQAEVSPRTVRWHVRKLGLTDIKQTLPALVESLKKRS